MASSPATSLIRLADLAGRRALVTGASAGIGRAVATALSAQGAHVVGLDVNAPLAVAASAAATGAISHYPCDLRDAASVSSCVAAAVAASGGALDYVVNVAGADSFYSLAEGGAEPYEAVMGLNLRAPYLVLVAASAALDAGVGKAVVNVSSINARLGIPRRTLYTSAKGGVQSLTRGLSRELGARGIRVNTVSPGWVMTDTQRRAVFDTPAGPAAEAFLSSVQSLPAKRITADDVAASILFLLSNASGAVTGSNLVVDAGWTLE